MRLESYERSNYKRPEIRDFRDKELGSKGQTKDIKKKRYLSRLYSNSNCFKNGVYIKYGKKGHFTKDYKNG